MKGLLAISILLFIGHGRNIGNHRLHQGELILPGLEKVYIRLATTPEEQIKGLSGLSPDHFSDKEGMLFWNDESDIRQYWMPNTYFDLDVFFLDKNFVVLEIDRNMPHHPGMKSTPPIARTRSIYSHHVLELKSSSPLSQQIKKGSRLIWRPYLQKRPNTRPQQ